ncbi:MAG: acyltransferase [Phycisphaerales bacterium]
MTANAPGHWTDGPLPPNASVGPGTIISGSHAFKRFRSTHPRALTVGANSTLDGAHLSLGPRGRLVVGDWCLISGAQIMAEEEVRIGSYVAIGWNAAIADSDFHPLDPAQRIEDAIACSMIGAGRPRPPVEHRPVVIEDDVWIGPCATILKGVRIGAGSIVEAGALVTRDVPARSRVAGNPARVVGPVEAGEA